MPRKESATARRSLLSANPFTDFAPTFLPTGAYPGLPHRLLHAVDLSARSQLDICTHSVQTRTRMNSDMSIARSTICPTAHKPQEEIKQTQPVLFKTSAARLPILLTKLLVGARCAITGTKPATPSDRPGIGSPEQLSKCRLALMPIVVAAIQYNSRRRNRNGKSQITLYASNHPFPGWCFRMRGI